jgi:hypothetical protein
MLFRCLAIGALVFNLAGCASGVKQSNLESQQYLISQPAKSVSIRLNDEAKEKAGDNPRFNQHTLLDQIKRELVARDLLNETTPEAVNAIEIVIKDFHLRSRFSAVILGLTADSDHIVGDVILKDAAGKELSKFEVSASYTLRGFGGGQDEARMGWLYEKFAELTVAHLAGSSR